MKLVLLSIFLILPVALSVTNNQCKVACREEYGSVVGGRKVNNLDKSQYQNDVDCTCIPPWFDCRSQKECDDFCNRQRHVDKFCHFAGIFCILHIGLVY